MRALVPFSAAYIEFGFASAMPSRFPGRPPSSTFNASGWLAESSEDGWIVVAELVSGSARDGWWVCAVDRHLRVQATKVAGDNNNEPPLPAHDSDTPALTRGRWLALARRNSPSRSRPDLGVLSEAANALPDVDWVQRRYGRALLVAGQAKEALEVFQRMAQPDSADAAAAHFALEEYERALSCAEDALRSRYGLRELRLRGLALCELGRVEEGVESLIEAVLVRDPTYHKDTEPQQVHGRSVVVGTVMILQEPGRHARVLTLLKAERSVQYSPDLMYLKGRSLAELGRSAEAVELLRMARDKKHPDALRELTRVEAKLAKERVTMRRKGPTDEIDIDDEVRHKKLGVGVVVDIEDGRQTMVTVEFESGERTVPLRLLEVIR